MASRKNNQKVICSFLCLFMVLFSGRAHAQSLKEQLKSLKPLLLSDGVHALKIERRELLMVRGTFENGNAWGGKAYSVLIRQEDGSWQFVRRENKGWDGVLIKTQPHTGDEAITSVVFLIPKEGDAQNLYLLTIHRDYQESPIEKVPAVFTLSILQTDSDFGMVTFHTIKTETTKARYCSADVAAYEEFGIPLPEGGEVGECL